MAFLQLQKKNEAATAINNLVSQADLGITRLADLRAQLLDWQNTITNVSPAEYTNADRAELTAELTRLNQRINTEL